MTKYGGDTALGLVIVWWKSYSSIRTTPVYVYVLNQARLSFSNVVLDQS